MEVVTDEPGLQFYGGNFLDGQEIGKGKRGMKMLLWPYQKLKSQILSFWLLVKM